MPSLEPNTLTDRIGLGAIVLLAVALVVIAIFAAADLGPFGGDGCKVLAQNQSTIVLSC